MSAPSKRPPAKKSTSSPKGKKVSSAEKINPESVSEEESTSSVEQNPSSNIHNSETPSQQQNSKKDHFATILISNLTILIVALLTVTIFRPEIESYLRESLGLPINSEPQQESISQIVDSEISLIDKKYQNKNESIEKKFQDLQIKNKEIESSVLQLQSDISRYQDQYSGSILGGEEKISQLLLNFETISLSLQQTNADILRLHIINGLPFRVQLRNLNLSGIKKDNALSESMNILESNQDVGFSSYRNLSYRLEELPICGMSEKRAASLKPAIKSDSAASVTGSDKDQGWYDYIYSVFSQSLSRLVKITPISQDSIPDKESASAIEQNRECLSWQSDMVSALRYSPADSAPQQSVFALLESSSLPQTEEFEVWLNDLELSMQARLSIDKIISHLAPSP